MFSVHQVAVDLEEVEVRAHLNGTVACVVYGDSHRSASFVVLDGGVGQNHTSDGSFSVVFVHSQKLFDWRVNTDKSRAIGKHGFDLQQIDHFGHALHNIVASENGCSVGHHLFDGFAFACSFERSGGDEGHSLRIVEFQTSAQTAAGDVAQREQHQVVDFFWCKMHNC